MSYTGIAFMAFLISLLFDAQITRRNLLLSKRFWTSYAIILPFQLLTNWWLTSRKIVMYSPDAIIGWRIASAPVEDLLFGFSLIFSILCIWEVLNERRNQG
jgi:lycopene cyclase domain-containing protein